jgi:hypothetical protein
MVQFSLFIWGERVSGRGNTNGNASTFAGFGCSFLGVESTVYFFYLSVCLRLCIFFKTEPNLVFPLCVGSEGW